MRTWFLKITGIKLLKFCIILLVIIWCVFMIGVQRGLLKGRKIINEAWEQVLAGERAEWQAHQQIEADMLFVRFLEEIIRRESSGRHSVEGRDEERGLCQFKKDTFYWLSGLAGLKNPDWENEEQQIALLAWAVKNGYGGLWTTVKQMEKEIEDFLKNE